MVEEKWSKRGFVGARRQGDTQATFTKSNPIGIDSLPYSAFFPEIPNPTIPCPLWLVFGCSKMLRGRGVRVTCVVLCCCIAVALRCCVAVCEWVF